MTIKELLENSSVAGLSQISSSRKILRWFWILVIISGFSLSGYLIYESFQNWADNPYTTNIKTLPIDEISFPKVTVCPPKDIFTDLNYDLIMMSNLTLNNETKAELKDDVIQLREGSF